jgi:hypothetical protein
MLGVNIKETYGLCSLLFLGISCKPLNKTVVEMEIDEEEIIDGDGDGFLSDEDCDDANAGLNPSAPEVCDGVDNNCDGMVDEGVTLLFYLDADEDGFGDLEQPFEACEIVSGYAPNGNDCDDSNPEIFPSASEICDGVDNNCDGAVDEGVGEIYYQDADRDGFGAEGSGAISCEEPSGTARNNLDCDDFNADTSPMSEEYCDGIDNNCDGVVDEEGAVDTELFYQDRDSDGFGDPMLGIALCEPLAGMVDNNDDCDDIDTAVHPNASEICDGMDNDCDSLIDEDDLSLTDGLNYFEDIDGDGFGNAQSELRSCVSLSGWVLNDTDCDDSSAAINLDASEVCDGIDNDCDSLIDDGDSSVDPMSFTTYYQDSDQDGYGDQSVVISQCEQDLHSLNPLDCDDSDPNVHPLTIWYYDGDGDGFGDTASTLQSCVSPLNYVDNDLDCDDLNSDAQPNASWYTDFDGDGYGDPSSVPVIQCLPVIGSAPNASDCEDSNADIHPNHAEVCDGADHDCDGLIDYDLDGDGYSDQSCGGMDCDDSDPNVFGETGSIAICAALDCDSLLQDFPQTVDGIYWIDPDANGGFEAYCDMDISNMEGWTLVMRSIAVDIAYNDAVWTTASIYDENNYDFTQPGYSKYEAFNRLPFSQLRSSDLNNWSDDYVEDFGVNGYSSALELFSGAGVQLSLDSQNEAYFLGLISSSYYAPWNCTTYRDYGINQQAYLGTGFINAGGYCDWNGGARWGVRYNANHNNTGNHQGIGWGNYTTIGYAPQAISQLMWIR